MYYAAFAKNIELYLNNESSIFAFLVYIAIMDLPTIRNLQQEAYSNLSSAWVLPQEGQDMDKNIVQDQGMEKKTYSVVEIAKILGISERSAYYFCSHTTDFRVLHLGRLVRIPKESFDQWFSGCS